MPVYEYRCEKCGAISEFIERINEPPPIFFGRKRCKNCRSRKLARVLSRVSGHVERTHTETLNELKSMGNVQFVPDTRPKGPPGGVCPYEAAEKAEQEKTAAAKAEKERKDREPIVVGG